MPKRARPVPTHCPSCGEEMDQLACCNDWHAVYVARSLKEFMVERGHLPSEKELQEMDAASGSDPCDDCCWGACGGRRFGPGEECC